MPDQGETPFPGDRVMSFKVAVVGATGNVGREMLSILAERGVPANEVIAVASERSAGGEVSYGEDDVLKVEDLERFDFRGIDIALFSPGAKVSAVHAPRAAKAGCVVIDNTSHFRMDPDVPLVVPEVNPGAIAQYEKRGIIANPNCSTIQMVVALKPLHDLARIKRVVVATYQSVSGAGHASMDELFNQTRAFHEADRVQCDSALRRLYGRRCDQGRVEDGGRDPQDSRPRHRSDGDLRAGSRVYRPCRGDQCRVRSAAGRRRRAGRSAAHARYHRGRSPRRRGLCDTGRSGWRGSRLCQPYPARSDRRTRAQSLGRRRQFTQGCRTQRRPDRRDPGPRTFRRRAPRPVVERRASAPHDALIRPAGDDGLVRAGSVCGPDGRPLSRASNLPAHATPSRQLSA